MADLYPIIRVSDSQHVSLIFPVAQHLHWIDLAKLLLNLPLLIEK